MVKGCYLTNWNCTKFIHQFYLLRFFYHLGTNFLFYVKKILWNVSSVYRSWALFTFGSTPASRLKVRMIRRFHGLNFMRDMFFFMISVKLLVKLSECLSSSPVMTRLNYVSVSISCYSCHSLFYIVRIAQNFSLFFDTLGRRTDGQIVWRSSRPNRL